MYLTKTWIWFIETELELNKLLLLGSGLGSKSYELYPFIVS
jgi:hypothetical protein